MPPTSTGRRGSRSRRPLGGWGEKSDGPCQPAGVSALALCPAPRKGTERPALPTAVPREAPGLEETKAAGTYLGCKEGVGRGRGTPLTPGSRASRAAGPSRPPPLRSLSPSARCRPGAAAGEGARVRVCACAPVCACVPPVHCSISAPRCAPPSRRRRSLAGAGSAWRRAPAPPFPSRPASPHLLPVFKGRARLPWGSGGSAPAPPGLCPRPPCPAPS